MTGTVKYTAYMPSWRAYYIGRTRTVEGYFEFILLLGTSTVVIIKPPVPMWLSNCFAVQLASTGAKSTSTNRQDGGS